MFGIGPMELIIIAVIAIVFVGPQRLPEVMTKLGRLFVQVRRQTQDVRESINSVIKDAERDLELERVKKLRGEIEKIKAENLLKEGNEAKNPEFQYHESHYVDGKFTPPEGFIDTDFSDFKPYTRTDIPNDDERTESTAIAADKEPATLAQNSQGPESTSSSESANSSSETEKHPDTNK